MNTQDCVILHGVIRSLLCSSLWPWRGRLCVLMVTTYVYHVFCLFSGVPGEAGLQLWQPDRPHLSKLFRDRGQKCPGLEGRTWLGWRPEARSMLVLANTSTRQQETGLRGRTQNHCVPLAVTEVTDSFSSGLQTDPKHNQVLPVIPAFRGCLPGFSAFLVHLK